MTVRAAEFELPQRRAIVLRNEVDRYGFSHLLAQRVGLSGPPRSFGAWLHGWRFWDVQGGDEFGYADAPRDMSIVVSLPREKAILEREGFQRVAVGGLPFAYTTCSQKPRKKDTVVAFIPHGLAHLDRYDVPVSYLDYLVSIRADFDCLIVCVFGHDETRAVLMDELRRRGLDVIGGAHPEDANSLTRIRWIFEQFEYLIASGMGSHLLYAALCGCKPSIPGPFVPEEPTQFQKDPYLLRHPEALERCMHAFDESVNRIKYPWLFVDHPRKAAEMQEWARAEIGARYLLTGPEIVDVLGWTPMGQLRGAARGLSRKMRRKLAAGWNAIQSYGAAKSSKSEVV